MKVYLHKQMKKQFVLLLSLAAVFFLYSGSAFAEIEPADIDSHWAEKDILSANSEGWAYLEGEKFNPDKSASREEVIWMLIGALENTNWADFDLTKKNCLCSFIDKPSGWARERVSIAVSNGILGGYPDKSLMPKANITRAEFAVILSRLIDKDPVSGISPFTDNIPDWAFPGVTLAYSKGIITGFPDGSFKPQNQITKAEALVMIIKLKNLQIE